ncbi:MAG TPA: hypothetical protein VHB98_09980, partial [Chloroflexota bacterium]|nr:hypothetical protein [Chloroflexota bacterium]
WQPQKLYYSGLAREQFERWRRIAEEAGIQSEWLQRRPDDERPRGLPQERITTCVDVTPYLERKRAAFRCHRSQVRADHFMLTVSEDFARRAFYDECYIRARSLVEAPTPEDDLFAGLR